MFSLILGSVREAMVHVDWFCRLSVLPRKDAKKEPPIDVEIDHGPIVDCFGLITQSQGEESEHNSWECLHLPVGKFLPQTDSWPSLLPFYRDEYFCTQIIIPLH